MNNWLTRNNEKKHRISAALLAIVLIVLSLFTSGLTSAVCDLIAFSTLIIVLWMKIDSTKNKKLESLSSTDKLEIEP